jgi:hypothetical protein
MVWKLNRNGKYLVKMAYYHLMEIVIDNGSQRVQGDWIKIWKLKVPNKIKLFIWTCAHGSFLRARDWLWEGFNVQYDALCVMRLLRKSALFYWL